MCVMSMPASGADQHSIPRVNVVTELDYPRRLLVPEDALGVAGQATLRHGVHHGPLGEGTGEEQEEEDSAEEEEDK